MNYARNRHEQLIALFCIDLCTKQPPDPVMAAQLVYEYLNHPGSNEQSQAMPYQDEVMAHLCSVIRTVDDARRMKGHLTVGLDVLMSPQAREWLKPLDAIAFVEEENEAYDKYKIALDSLLNRGTATIDLEELGDETSLDRVKFDPKTPLGKETLDTHTIELLSEVALCGAYTVQGLAMAVGALKLLAANAEHSDAPLMTWIDARRLRGHLFDIVSKNPHKDMKPYRNRKTFDELFLDPQSEKQDSSGTKT